MFRLIVEKGPDRGRKVDLTGGRAFTVGRDTSCEVRLSDTMLSRQHFRVEITAKGPRLVDLGSMNGTLVNGSPVRTCFLEPGDLIRAGQSVLTLAPVDGPPDPLVGRTIRGRYRILERVGRGGMGTCYLARQLDLDRPVAVKVISPKRSADRAFIDRFIQEARFAARLNHPNVVQVYEVGKDQGAVFYSMEYIPNGSIADRIAAGRGRPFTPEQAVRVTLQVARALQYAHAKGIMHRDIKPENMLLTESGDVKLVDLGLAQSLGEKTAVAGSDYVLGTPHYIAPEIVRKEEFDFRSDIYSLGVCLYQMISGVLPYEAESVRELIRLKLDTEAPPLDEKVPGLPRSLVNLTARMIRRKPEERPGTIEEVIRELEEIRRRLTRSPVPMKILLPVTGAAILLLAALVIGVASSGEPPPPPPPAPEENPEELALRVFTNADAFELRKMDAASVESIRRAIDRYREVVDRFPGTSSAEKARERIRKLSERIASLQAQQRLAELTTREVRAFTAFVASIERGKPETRELEEVIEAYRALGTDPELGKTEGASTAGKRAERLRDCLEEVGSLAAEFMKERERLRYLVPARRRVESLQVWARLLKQVAAAKKRLAYEQADRALAALRRRIEDERAAVLAELMQAVDEHFRQVDRAVGIHDFKRAKALLEEGRKILGVTEGVLERFEAKRKEIEAERLAYERELERKREEERRRKVEADRETFERMCLDVFEGYTRKYRFEKAIGEVLEAPRFRFQTRVFDDRIAAKREQLRRADLLLKSFVNAVNDPRDSYKLVRKVDVPGRSIRGTLKSAEAGGITVETEAGERMFIAFDLMEPWQLAEVVERAWTIRDLETLRNWIALLAEIGMGPQARAALARLAEHPSYSTHEGARKFHERYEAALSFRDPIDPPGVEARKRLGIARSLFDNRRYDELLAVLEELRGPLRDTAVVREADREIRQMEETARRKAAERKK